jgi:hypothetical protein
MNLNNFESYIDRIIFLRGYDYYENGYVISVEERSEGVFEAEVEGTQNYTVDVEIDENLNIVDTQCDCPYDMGEYCKHQVAVFLSLKDMKNNTSGKNDTDIKKTITKGNDLDIGQLLEERTKDELIEFLLSLAYENEEVSQRILLAFDNGNDEDEITKSVSLIHAFIRNNSDQHGFVSYRNTDNAVNGAELVLEKAESALEEGKIIHAVNLALCVIREMVELIQNADDSSGTIGGIISQGISFVDETIENTDLSTSEKNSIFENIIKEAQHRRYDGWSDWKLELLESCSKLTNTSELRDKLEKHMSQMVKNEGSDLWSGNYFAEKINLIRYNMILNQDGEKKAQEFVRKNLQYSSFRKMEIESAMKKNDYEQVINLSLEGEAKDKDFRGLLNDWMKYRYQAYKLSGKFDEQRGLAMNFILDGDFGYYKELKNTYEMKEWVDVYPKIIFLFENQKKSYLNIFTSILIEEGEKHKLLEYVKEKPSSIERYYKHLIPEFKDDVYKIFIQYIELVASSARNRNDYQSVCAIIRNLKKAGGTEQALEIKQQLYTKYANRPAFRDELTRV